MEVPLLDHLLVGGEGDYSMRDRGDVTLEPFAGEAAAIGERYMAQPPTWGSRARRKWIGWTLMVLTQASHKFDKFAPCAL